ncbi:conjugative relaxase-like TrwC/TraI family protein [Bradyrhizobium japonicum]|uniref:MobF family relaxase n=1 Tax=Bradyrhizobium japonicum TaxID=375 RepID=UPI003399E6DF
MVASLQIGTAATYYARDYYHGGERQIAATWFARGSQFDLTHGGAVDIERFAQLHAGLDQEGRWLLTTSSRKVEGVDFTFSPSKSVSLAYALTTDLVLRQAILDVHLTGVHRALEVLEEEGTYARRGRDGLDRRHVRLTGALFTHDTARPAPHLDGSVFSDPQLHTHSVLFNLAMRDDLTIGCIDTRLGQIKTCLGSIHAAHTAYELRKLGFAIQEIGKHGSFEVGFDPEVRKFFSSRRNQIEDELAESGQDSASAPAVAAAATLSTRRSKQRDDGTDRFELWQGKAVELGLVPGLCVENLRGVPNLDHGGRDETFEAALAKIPEVLTEHEATFSRIDVIRAVGTAHVGTAADPAHLMQRVDRLIASGRIVEIRKDQLKEPVYSTPEMVRLERETIDLAKQLANRRWSGPELVALNEKAVAAGLSGEQAAAANTLAEGRALALLQGKAGTAKTYSLKPLVAQFKEDGHRVIAAAASWRTAEMLAEELQVEARAIDSWLAIARTGGRFLDPKTVLIVDEVGLLGAKATHAILKEATRDVATCESTPAGLITGQAKVVLCGDSSQLKPIAASAGLELVRLSTESAVLQKVVRQRDPKMRRAVEHLAHRRVDAAFKILEAQDCVVETDGQKPTIQTAVDRWFAARQERPGKDHLLIARSNATVRGLNAEIRRRLRTAGQLLGRDISVTASSTSGDPYALRLAVGDRIRFGRRTELAGHRIINGTCGKIEHIEQDGRDHANITARIGRHRVSFSTRGVADEHGHARLSHDYATTVYQSQGLTAESCTAVIDPRYDRNALYVAASRARGALSLVIDRAGIDAHIKAARPRETRQRDVTAAERRALLLKVLSRESVKTSTIEPSEFAQAEVASDRDRQHRKKRELSNEL